MTFKYMVHMISTRKEYSSFILSALHRKSSRLTKMHNLSREPRCLYVLDF